MPDQTNLFRDIAQRILQSSAVRSVVSEKNIDALSALLQKNNPNITTADKTARHIIASSHQAEITAFVNALPTVGEPPADVAELLEEAVEEEYEEVEVSDPESADDEDDEVQEEKDEDKKDKQDEEEVEEEDQEAEEEKEKVQAKRKVAEDATDAMLYIVELISNGNSFEDARQQALEVYPNISIQRDQVSIGRKSMKAGQLVSYRAIPTKTAKGTVIPSIPVKAKVLAVKDGQVKLSANGVEPFWVPVTISRNGEKLQIVVALEEDPKDVRNDDVFEENPVSAKKRAGWTTEQNWSLGGESVMSLQNNLGEGYYLAVDNPPKISSIDQLKSDGWDVYSFGIFCGPFQRESAEAIGNDLASEFGLTKTAKHKDTSVSAKKRAADFKAYRDEVLQKLQDDYGIVLDDFSDVLLYLYPASANGTSADDAAKEIAYHNEKGTKFFAKKRSYKAPTDMTDDELFDELSRLESMNDPSPDNEDGRQSAITKIKKELESRGFDEIIDKQSASQHTRGEGQMPNRARGSVQSGPNEVVLITQGRRELLAGVRGNRVYWAVDENNKPVDDDKAQEMFDQEKDKKPEKESRFRRRAEMPEDSQEGGLGGGNRDKIPVITQPGTPAATNRDKVPETTVDESPIQAKLRLRSKRQGPNRTVRVTSGSRSYVMGVRDNTVYWATTDGKKISRRLAQIVFESQNRTATKKETVRVTQGSRKYLMSVTGKKVLWAKDEDSGKDVPNEKAQEIFDEESKSDKKESRTFTRRTRAEDAPKDAPKEKPEPEEEDKKTKVEKYRVTQGRRSYIMRVAGKKVVWAKDEDTGKPVDKDDAQKVFDEESKNPKDARRLRAEDAPKKDDEDPKEMTPEDRKARADRLARLQSVIKRTPVSAKNAHSANADSARDGKLRSLHASVDEKKREIEVLAKKNRRLEAEKTVSTMLRKGMITPDKKESELRTLLAMDDATWKATNHLVETFTVAPVRTAASPQGSRRVAGIERDVQNGYGLRSITPSTAPSNGITLDDPDFFND